MKRWVVTALAAAVALGCAATTPASPGADSAGDPYQPSHGNGGYDVSKYVIVNEVEVTPARLTSGTTTIAARATHHLRSFTLDLQLPVDRVLVDGDRTRFSQERSGRTAGKVVVTPARPISQGAEFATTVTYHGDGDIEAQSWATTDREVLVTGEPRAAEWWFPSNDHPRDAALFDVTIDVPRGLQAISVGRSRSVTTSADRTRWRWVAAEPMQTYAAFFAAGDYDLAQETVDGVRFTYAVSRALAPNARATNMRLLRLTPSIIAAQARDFGPYPFSDGGGLVTGTFRNEDWAMENQTRPVYPAMQDDPTGRRLLAHELAHQWFGNLVRPRRWRDIVNNEAFPRWAEMRWSELNGGISAAAQLEAGYAARPAGGRFWRLVLDDPGRAHLFDAAVYDRGGMMVQALRNKVGERAFLAVLRAWTSQYAGRAARVVDFERLAADVSGHDLRDFFEAWLRTPTRPAHTAANGLGR